MSSTESSSESLGDAGRSKGSLRYVYIGMRSSKSPVPPSSRFFADDSRRREGRSEGFRIVGLALSLSGSILTQKALGMCNCGRMSDCELPQVVCVSFKGLKALTLQPKTTLKWVFELGLFATTTTDTTLQLRSSGG